MTFLKDSPASPLNRRKFMASLGLIGAAASLNPLASLSRPARAPDLPKGVMKCKPYLQALLADQVTVRWITHGRCYSWVEYGEAADQLGRKAYQVEEGQIQSDNTIHAIALQNLEPGKTYYYRAVSRELKSLVRKKVSFGEQVASEVYSFQTPQPAADQVSFLVFNDIHDRPESFAQLMKWEEPGRKDFVLLNGDMFNFQENEDQIVHHLLHPLGELFSTQTPFLYCRGNHETWGDYSRNLRDYFDGRSQKFYYALQAGPMYALVLDSGESKADDDQVHGGMHAFDAYREAQARWLEQEVQKKAFRKASFRVVFVHIPLYHMADDVHANLHCRQVWGPILNKANIDLMVCGHTHKHGIHPAEPGKHHYPIVIGGGPTDGKRTLTHITVNKKTLNLVMKNDRGETVGRLSL
ncbi:MAG: metallophosphoesterase [Adhaeribacter sp.]